MADTHSRRAAENEESHVTTKATETTTREDAMALETRMPDILDDVLGQLSQVGVERILKLAGEMTAARLAAPPDGHLALRQGERN